MTSLASLAAVRRCAYAGVLLQMFLWTLTGVSTPAAAAAVELGEAPRREVTQDAAPLPRVPQARAGVTRAAAVARYHSEYLAQSQVPLGWTGNVNGCLAGSTSLAHQQAVIARINYYRALTGLPAATLDTAAGDLQAAALLMSANASLSHAPPPSWLCYSLSAVAGAASANLALGAYGVAAVDLYMDDSGAGNAAVGHRRWLLYPPRASFASGDTEGGSGAFAANALGVFGATTTRPATPEGVAWPPAGYVPYQNLPWRSGRWSLSYPGADFSTATVSVTGPGGALPVTREAIANGYGDNTIVFVPSGVSYAAPAADTAYRVTVSGIGGSGVPATIAYTVIAIDPASTPVDPSPVTVVEYHHAAFDHYFVTWLPDEIAKLDAGVFTGWARTGQAFAAWPAVVAGTSPVCRIYIVPAAGDSHFYGRDAAECAATIAAHPEFVLEAAPFMALAVPVAGACAAGTVPVYRVFNHRADANHRYTTSAAIRATMEAAGWIVEGDGADRIAYCAPA